MPPYGAVVTLPELKECRDARFSIHSSVAGCCRLRRPHADGDSDGRACPYVGSDSYPGYTRNRGSERVDRCCRHPYGHARADSDATGHSYTHAHGDPCSNSYTNADVHTNSRTDFNAFPDSDPNA